MTEDHEGESHKGRLPLPHCGPVAFSWGEGFKGGGVASSQFLCQDKDGKGERIRAEALVV